MSDLWGTQQQHNQPSMFYQNEDGNFCLRCCCRRSCLFRCCSGRCQLIVCVARPASVAHVTRGASVMWLCFLLFFASSLLHVLLLFSTFLSWEIWGINMPNIPEVSRLEDLLFLGCVSCTCVAVLDAPLMMIVVAGWVLLWNSQRPHDVFVAFVGKAALWLQGWLPWLSSSCSRVACLVSALVLHNDSIDCVHHDHWWLWLCPLQSTMMLLPVVACCNCA